MPDVYEQEYVAHGTREQLERLLPALMVLRDSKRIYGFTIESNGVAPTFLTITATVGKGATPRDTIAVETEVLDRLEETGCRISSPSH